MNRYVLSFVTLDEVLRRFPRGVMCVSLELRVRRELFEDDSTDPASFGIPSHVIPDLEN